MVVTVIATGFDKEEEKQPVMVKPVEKKEEPVVVEAPTPVIRKREVPAPVKQEVKPADSFATDIVNDNDFAAIMEIFRKDRS
jgi:hypothetical protein